VIDRFAARGGWWVASQVLLLAGVIFSGRRHAAGFESASVGVVGNVLAGAGLTLGLWAAWSLRRGLTPYPEPLPGRHLIDTGPYRFVRHPMYSAVILFMLGLALRYADWIAIVLAAALIPFFWLKSSHEEGRLGASYPGYPEYQKRVTRRLIPGIL
jgi:protein-S-isoprenylcysteine O-methyltransferase Ste14